MWIIGVDYHPSVQQIAFVNTDTGECGERRMSHSDGESEKFYRELKATGCRVRVWMEATGHARWFEQLLGGLNIELWVGDTAPARLTGAVGSIEPDDRGVKRSRRAGSPATARGVAPDDASWGGTYYRPGLRADH